MTSLDFLRWCVVILAALVPGGAAAGVRFDFASEVSGVTYSYRGRMIVDGTSSRIDVTEGTHPLFNPKFSIITRDAGRQIVVLDHSRRTFFNRNGSTIAGHLGTTRGLGNSIAEKPRVRSRRSASSVDGVATQRHSLHAEYRLNMNVEGESIEATVIIDATFDVLRDVPQRALQWGLQYAAKSGYAVVDRQLAAYVPRHLPLRQVVTASRRIANGPVVTETITTTVTNVVHDAIDAKELAVPDGYRYEEPAFVFGGP